MASEMSGSEDEAVEESSDVAAGTDLDWGLAGGV